MSESTPEPAEDTQAQQLIAEAVFQPPETEAAPEQAGQQSKESPEPAKFDATQWAALFGQEDPNEIKRQLEHARTWEKRAKENRGAFDELQQIKDAQKTEAQRLADRLAAAESERDEERRGRARLMAAASHNLPTSLIDRIGGSTEEEINESAAALATELDRLVAERSAAGRPAAEPEAEQPKPAQRRPVESLTPGAKPASERPQDPDSWLRQMAGRGP